jgi:hypothetical protein
VWSGRFSRRATGSVVSWRHAVFNSKDLHRFGLRLHYLTHPSSLVENAECKRIVKNEIVPSSVKKKIHANEQVRMNSVFKLQ